MLTLSDIENLQKQFQQKLGQLDQQINNLEIEKVEIRGSLRLLSTMAKIVKDRMEQESNQTKTEEEKKD